MRKPMRTVISRAELPCGKDVAIIRSGIDVRGFQRWPGEEFEPFDTRILDHTPLPGNARIQIKEV